MCVLSFYNFNECSLVQSKEWIKWLIIKTMPSIYYSDKLTFSEPVGKEYFSERKLEEMH